MKQLVLACFAARAVVATTCDVTDAVSCTVKLEEVQQAARSGRRDLPDICAGWQAYSKCQLHVGCWAGSPEGDAFKQACVDYVRRDGPTPSGCVTSTCDLGSVVAPGMSCALLTAAVVAYVYKMYTPY